MGPTLIIFGTVLLIAQFFLRGQKGFMSSSDPFTRGWGRGSVWGGRAALVVGAGCLAVGALMTL